ncbi:MAG: SO_0444 family Cu/Zn efflux transporter [Sedimentisphaerales bacterium]|nr:SO_0444 family Cu/Zn efflux transporter [Sedimentisphaerales bacterium]
MEILWNILVNIWHILLELSPWLLLGMLIAGGLHVLLPEGFIKRHLGSGRFASVFKAVAVGVPMPLCSCGVIPAAIGLKKDGASDGAAIGFLISTPQTGVDSILVSASLLGWPFALFKVVSALVSGLIGGLLVSFMETIKHKSKVPASCCHAKTSCCNSGEAGTGMKNSQPSSSACCSESKDNHPGGCCGSEQKKAMNSKWREALHFSFIELLRDIYRWLIIGVVIAAVVSTFIPEGRLAEITWTQGLMGMLVMLAISLPMYICAVASVPLAASLIVAGMSPGSALVLLMAGPTTNIATMGTIYRTFGKQVLIIYLSTVAIMSISLGLIFDWLLAGVAQHHEAHVHPLPLWLESGAAVVLILLLGYLIFTDLRRRVSYPLRKLKKSLAD